MKITYKHTLIACYVCFIIQSIVNNFSPLLFATYSREFQISLDQLTILVTFNFVVQMLIDAIGVKYARRIGHRRGMLVAHLTSFLGIIGIGLFTKILPPFAGLLVSTALCAMGSGFIEVLASPIVEALPTEEKSSAMSLLHSFYCWGHIAIVLLSTLFFAIFGMDSWRVLTYLWALIPALNCILFVLVPLAPMQADEENHGSIGEYFKIVDFRIFLVLMICAGAMEQAIAQWSSLFAENGLGVTKTVGDLLGPCLFALMMALARTFYGVMGGRINLSRFMTVCAAGIFGSFLLTVFAPHPVLSLIGCGMAGLFVGIYWPGSLSLAAARMPAAGTTMFALLAFAGDIGCSLGPGIVGIVADVLGGSDGLKAGILCAAIFPAVAIAALFILKKRKLK